MPRSLIAATCFSHPTSALASSSLYACACVLYATQQDSGSQVTTWGQSLTKARGHGRWEAVCSPWPLCNDRPCHLSEPAPPEGLKECLFTLPPLLRIFLRAGQAPQRQRVNILSTSGLCGFWANYTRSPPSFIRILNHTRIAAFINTSWVAEIELLGWYKSNQRKALWATLKMEYLVNIELSTLSLFGCF